MPTYHKAREENERLKREISRLQDDIDQLHARLDKMMTWEEFNAMREAIGLKRARC